MKKIVSMLLLFCMLGTMIIPMTVSAEETTSTQEETVATPGGVYTFDDWVDPCFYPSNKYTSVATTVLSVNNDPALSFFPLGVSNDSAATFFSNRIFIPMNFQPGKTYAIAYDVAMLEQPNNTGALEEVMLNVSATVSSTANDAFAYNKKDVTVNTAKVAPDAWTHVTGELAIGKDQDWFDCIAFWEDGTYSTHFLIDNLVIMEKDAFATAYPEGIATRTDNPSNGPDMLVSDFNSSRYTIFRSNMTKLGNANSDNLSVTLAGDGVLTWGKTSGNVLYVPFHVQYGKTYKVSFDIAVTDIGDKQFTFTAIFATKNTTTGLTEGETRQTISLIDKIEGGISETEKFYHVETTLTPDKADYKYIILGRGGTGTAVILDNFKLVEEGSEGKAPIMPERTLSYGSSTLLMDFEDGNTFFANNFKPGDSTVSVENIALGGVNTKALKLQPSNAAGVHWTKLIAPYAFTEGATYRVSYDVYVVGTDTKLGFYTLPQDWTTFEQQTKKVSTSITSGKWQHISFEFKAGNDCYMGFCEFPTENDTVYYLDNLTVAKVESTCTKATHSGTDIAVLGGVERCTSCDRVIRHTDAIRLHSYQISDLYEVEGVQKYDVRLIAELDSLEYAGAGFDIIATLNGKRYYIPSEISTVAYKSVNARDNDGKLIQVNAAEGKWFIAITVTGISENELPTFTVFAGVASLDAPEELAWSEKSDFTVKLDA